MTSQAPLPLDGFPEFLLVREVAELFRLRPETVRLMIMRKELPAVRLSGGRGDFRVPKAAIQKILDSVEVG